MTLSIMVILLSRVLLMLSVTYTEIPSVPYAEYHLLALYAECHYAECHYAECRYAECH
jgi:hypothetical protein